MLSAKYHEGDVLVSHAAVLGASSRVPARNALRSPKERVPF